MKRNASVILLFDENKKILLQHRTKDAPHLPNYWAFFGGGIEQGETPLEAVRRETKEELNYELTDPKLVMTQKFKYKDVVNTKYVFMESFNAAKELEQLEGKDMNWFIVPETADLKIVDHDREVLSSPSRTDPPPHASI